MSKTVIIIAGPTAVGKTRVAIEVARQFGTEIISADSRQCYRELKIGVARPSEEELAAVPHHFIASHSIHDKLTAADFETYALEKARSLFRHHDIVVMTGGTGLYIRAFCDGMDAIPDIPQAVREEIRSGYDVHGLPWLQEAIRKADPQFHTQGEMQNPQRIMRALEVVKTTGKSVLSFRKKEKAVRPFSTIPIALHLPREILHRYINNRVDKMIEGGLLEEVRSLIPYKHLNALQTVGYRELFPLFAGETTVDEAVSQIRKSTRLYAKRQMTWFRNTGDFHWLEPDAQQVLQYISEQ